jgi:hypothetical protein
LQAILPEVEIDYIISHNNVSSNEMVHKKQKADNFQVLILIADLFEPIKLIF